MMLSRDYRLAVNNQSAVNVNVTIKARLWKRANDGTLTIDTAESTLLDASAIASSTTAWTAGTAQDNSNLKWEGAFLVVTVTPASSATLRISVELQHSTDAGATWVDSGLGVGVGGYLALAASASAAKFNLEL